MPKKSTKKSSSKKTTPNKTVKRSKKPAKSISKEIKTNKEAVKVLKATELYNLDSVYCQFDVSNYKNSIQFYKDVLEWNPSKFSENSPDPETIGWFEFELPVKGAFLGLGKSQDGTVKPSSSLVISVKDLEQFKHTMETKKANPSNITDIPNMISFLTVNDPDNNSIMFISEPRVKG